MVKFLNNPNSLSARIYTFTKNNPKLPQNTKLEITYYQSESTLAQLIIDKIIEKNGINSNIYGVTGAATY